MYAAQTGVDFALISLFLFFAFFTGLIFYLRREDRREGYPLEEDGSGRLQTAGGFLFMALPKTFKLPSGDKVSVPNGKRDRRPLAARRTGVAPGSPIVPTGNPLIDGIGPASYADRAKVPELTTHGDPKIVPLRVARHFEIASGDLDPRGLQVVGADRRLAGVVKDIWVDRVECTIRYLEVALDGGTGSVLLPMTMALVRRGARQVYVDAITAAQFVDVPKIAGTDQVTFYEEERIVAYYGGGFLYAHPARSEPLI